MDNTFERESENILPNNETPDLWMITYVQELLQHPSPNLGRTPGNPALQMLRQRDSDLRIETCRALDAFALLVAIDDAIVAVTTKTGALIRSPTMEIVACSHARHRSNSMSPPSTVSSLPGALEVDPKSPQIIRLEQSAIDPQNPIPHLKDLLTSRSIPLHAAALVSLLNAAGQGQGDNLGIFFYVATTSNQKMLRRFEDDTEFSQVFEHLLKISPSQATQSSRKFPGNQDDSPLAALPDAALLEALKVPFNEQFFRLSTIGIENLMAMAMAYNPGAAIPSVYTKQTCEEIHRLLCHLLRSYKASIATLTSSSTEGDAEQFEMAVYAVATCGMTLGALSCSTFIDEHMWRILPSDNLEGSEPDVGVHDNSGSYFGRHAYADRLRSLAVYYEAAGRLLRMGSRFRGMQFSLEILTVPPSETSMRPWKQVVEALMSSPISMTHIRYTPSDAISAIETFISTRPDLSARLKSDMLIGRNFHATLHSQACLASMILRSDPDNVDSDRVFGVSEQCCHVCSRLISFLGIPEPCNPIHEEPSMRQRVVACTLPSWLPLRIHDAMISHFGAELLLVIQKLCTGTGPSDSSTAPSRKDPASMSWFSVIVDKIRGLL